MVGPPVWPVLAGDFHPGRRATKIRLDVSLNAVGRGQGVCWQGAPEVADSACLHCCGTRLEVFEDGRLCVLVTYLVAEEDSTSFVLPRGVTYWQFGPLLDHDRRETAVVNGK